MTRFNHDPAGSKLTHSRVRPKRQIIARALFLDVKLTYSGYREHDDLSKFPHVCHSPFSSFPPLHRFIRFLIFRRRFLSYFLFLKIVRWHLIPNLFNCCLLFFNEMSTAFPNPYPDGSDVFLNSKNSIIRSSPTITPLISNILQSFVTKDFPCGVLHVLFSFFFFLIIWRTRILIYVRSGSSVNISQTITFHVGALGIYDYQTRYFLFHLWSKEFTDAIRMSPPSNRRYVSFVVFLHLFRSTVVS